MLYSLGGVVVCSIKSHWFLWEPAWNAFRPITSIAWDGTAYDVDDRAYCADPMDPLYGYGSSQMKTLCDRLTATYAAHVPTVQSESTVPVGPSEWFYDRMVALTPCAPRDRASWKRMTKGRTRTVRAGPRNKWTRRTLPHS